MFKINVLNKISEKGLTQLPAELYQTASDLIKPDAILLRSADMHSMDIPSSLLFVGRAGVGVNNIPIAELTKRGIPVFNTPSANSNAVRELVIAGMLLASRNICQAWNFLSQLDSTGDELNKKVEQSKSQFIGTELAGKTLGVIGLGNIGVKVANAALALGMKVIGYDNYINTERAWELSSHVEKAPSLNYLYSHADYISVHVTLTNETKEFINKDAIDLMRAGTIILNFSRGEVVDHGALADALNEHKIGAYVSDFPTAELQHHPRVIYLPHLGASTKEAEENCAVMIVKQMRQYLEVGSITNSVNFPSIDAPLVPGHMRIAITNQNIPNMVAQITSKLGALEVNISHLANVSRDDIAYTLLDINQHVDSNLLHDIASINGVLTVRKIV